MNKILRILVVSLIFLCACSQVPQSTITHLNPAETNALLDSKNEKGLFVLNVHTPYEGKLDGTDAIIEDWENLAAHQDQLPKDKSTPLLVYCRSGRMSTSAIDQLEALGYTNLYHLDGGMKAYEAAGFPLLEKTWT